jgi:deazaflavin-dependent oxidoreductase (nitroreductase family)
MYCVSNLHERNDRDVTASSSYNLNDGTVFKKQIDELNPPIIEEFRSNGGKVGGQFTGHNMLLLHTIGAKSHQPRVNPIGYMRDGDAFVIIASKAGAPTNPDWYHNILAHPEVELEVGTERFKAHATIPEREERAEVRFLLIACVSASRMRLCGVLGPAGFRLTIASVSSRWER